jgi:hypothetical protein
MNKKEERDWGKKKEGKEEEVDRVGPTCSPRRPIA